jgi:hypothetical protein
VSLTLPIPACITVAGLHHSYLVDNVRVIIVSLCHVIVAVAQGCLCRGLSKEVQAFVCRAQPRRGDSTHPYSDANQDLPGDGVLDGVGEAVEDRLFAAEGIGQHYARHHSADLEANWHGAHGSVPVHDGLEELPRCDGANLDGELARLEANDVQDVFNQAEA